MKLKFLPFSLVCLLSVSINTHKAAYAQQAEQPVVQAATPNPQLLDRLLQRVLNQLATTDKALEELAQSVNNNSIKVDDKKAIRDYVTSLRSFILEVRQGKQFDLTHDSIPLILDVNKSLLTLINTSLVTGLKALPALETHEIVKRSSQIEPFNLRAIKSVLDHNEAALKDIPKNYSFVGSTSLNRFTKRTVQLANQWSIPTITQRALPYVGLTAYYVFMTNEKSFPGCKIDANGDLIARNNQPFITRQLLRLKERIGGLSKPTTRETIDRSGLPRDASGAAVMPGVPVAPPVPLDQWQALTLDAKQHEYYQYAQASSVRQQLQLDQAVLANLPRVSKGSVEPGTGYMGAIEKRFGSIISIKPERVYTWAPATLLTPIIMKDAKDLANWSATQAMKTLAYLKGESYDTGSPVKASRSAFADVIGLSQAKAELGKLVSYFKHKSNLDRTGAVMERGYLLVGPVDAGKSLAHALAGEITKELKAQKKTDKCGVYDIHASVLLKKELSDIIKEADKATPAIIVINELDWLARQEVDAKVWGDIVTNMTGAIKNPKKPVIIIATAQDTQALTQALGISSQLGVTISFGQPTEEDRAQFFTRELANHGISKAEIAEFNVAELARQTSGSSLASLGTVVKHALNRAHIAQRTLTHDDIEQSIDTVVYGINTQHRSRLTIEKQVLAAHYAGKMVAHTNLDMVEQLVKATILPVTTATGIRQGALFTYVPEHRALTTTQQDKEKAIVIELAGLAAQEALLGSVSHSFAQETKQKAFTHIKEIVFEGINEQDMPKELKNTKLTQVWQLMDEYKQRAQAIVQANQARLRELAHRLETEQTITAYYTQN